MSTPFINFGGMGPRFLCRAPRLQVTKYGIAAATPLPEPGLQMTNGALFWGVGPAAPRPANGPPSLPVGTPSATCQLCLPSHPFNLSPTSQRCG
ncbi:hypothetical protein M441DRAFT_66632 [Trichoderma asperellum CBS 433.97]|uniref:Uncharacterized protein n=1 Tax=Trichoderma asperellum (strain ATCC 204424 / CBS 433.97 / NBRC 101777) TaxID=1042311 RepID=A0A2T3ZDI7_TRIA4|nr:hypothetical protein M441DRAFT_66632 [Trichoderma asperellum CBS 433.97]PTB42867.1 hypothetical protein M441DRAFT_66632 [Trichoderma asperellum CBS 433.97]